MSADFLNLLDTYLDYWKDTELNEETLTRLSHGATDIAAVYSDWKGIPFKNVVLALNESIRSFYLSFENMESHTVSGGHMMYVEDKFQTLPIEMKKAILMGMMKTSASIPGLRETVVNVVSGAVLWRNESLADFAMNEDVQAFKKALGRTNPRELIRHEKNEILEKGLHGLLTDPRAPVDLLSGLIGGATILSEARNEEDERKVMAVMKFVIAKFAAGRMKTIKKMQTFDFLNDQMLSLVKRNGSVDLIEEVAEKLDSQLPKSWKGSSNQDLGMWLANFMLDQVRTKDMKTLSSTLKIMSLIGKEVSDSCAIELIHSQEYKAVAAAGLIDEYISMMDEVYASPLFEKMQERKVDERERFRNLFQLTPFLSKQMAEYEARHPSLVEGTADILIRGMEFKREVSNAADVNEICIALLNRAFKENPSVEKINDMGKAISLCKGNPGVDVDMLLDLIDALSLKNGLSVDIKNSMGIQLPDLILNHAEKHGTVDTGSEGLRILYDQRSKYVAIMEQSNFAREIADVEPETPVKRRRL